MANQGGGQKFIFVDVSNDAICKLNDGSELDFYRVCRSSPDRLPMLTIMPEVVSEFKLRLGIDRFDLSQHGVTEEQMLAMHSQIRENS